MKEIKDGELEGIVLKSDKLILCDLWAEWCYPCKVLTPILEEISKEYSEKVEILKCNVDDNPNIAMQYEVRSIPTILFFKDGKLINRSVGAVPKNSLETKIKTLL